MGITRSVKYVEHRYWDLIYTRERRFFSNIKIVSLFPNYLCPVIDRSINQSINQPVINKNTSDNVNNTQILS